MDGYRNILEHLLGSIGQPQQPPPSHPPNQDNPPFPGQQRQFWGSTTSSGSFPGPFPATGIQLDDATATSPSQQPRRPTRQFHYSMTTYGPDGAIHHISSNPRPGSPMPEGRQIAVPTLEDFLGMHAGHPGYAAGGVSGYDQDPFSNGSIGMMLQHMMQGMTIHGNPGDYLRPVFPRISEKLGGILMVCRECRWMILLLNLWNKVKYQLLLHLQQIKQSIRSPGLKQTKL